MQSTPDRGYVQILNYQDHFTKFLVLKPMKSKSASETAYNLIDIFTTIGAPMVLQSDNGREFVASVIDELKTMWPMLRIVHGRARHPQSQGSVERANADIKQMLIAWTIDNETRKWGEGLRFVQLQKNSSPHRNLSNRCPYQVLFGQKPLLGIERTALPKEVMDKLETEEELDAALLELIGHQSEAATETPEDDQLTQLHDEDAQEDAEETQSEDAEATEAVAVQEDSAARLRDQQLEEAEHTDQADILEQSMESMEVDTETEASGGGGAEKDVSDMLRRLEQEESDTTDPVEQHISRIDACREDAAAGQAKSRDQMMASSNLKQPQLAVGDCVLLPVSEFDRGRLDCRNIPGVISQVTPRGLYRVATKHGVVNTLLSRNQLLKADCQLLTLDETVPEVHSFRKLASLHSQSGGQGFSKCSCATKCDTKRCACRKKGTLCHSHCHPRNSKCKNK